MRPFVMSSIYLQICFALYPKIKSAHGNCHQWLIVPGSCGSKPVWGDVAARRKNGYVDIPKRSVDLVCLGGHDS